MTDQKNDSQFMWPQGTEKNKHTNVPAIIISLVLTLLLVIILGFYIYLGMQNTPADQQEVVDTPQNTDAPATELSEDEKMRRLESLPANPNPLSEEEKMERLQQIETAVDIPLEDQLERLKSTN